MKFSKAEIEAVIEASPRTTIPFNKLILSVTYQARPAGSTSKMSIAELAASIKESNVLQNLIVMKGARGLFEVCAGGRRLEALTLLVVNGDIAENYPVPVLIVAADKALIASLAENCFHIPLHPAEEYTAFAKLTAQGKSVEDVAAAFGVTPLVVKRRMKLATVSPQLMTQFREDKIGLDCLMVLASVDDHDKQEQTWAGVPTWNRRPDYLRQLLTQGEIESDRDPVAKYVTVKAYEKAGGTLRRDLFSDDDKKAYLLDAALLEKLATNKLQKKAKQVAADGWKWVDVRVRYSYDEFVKYGELRRTRREPTEREAADIAALQAKAAALHDRMEALAEAEADEGDADNEYEKLETESESLQTQIKALEDTLSVWPTDLMAQAGCVVYVGNDGAAALKCGLVRPEDRNDMAQAARLAGEGSDDESLVSLPSPKTRPVHSDKLMRRLTAHRVAAVQAELIDRPDVALAAITAHLAVKLLVDGYRRHYGNDDALTVSATNTHVSLPSEADDMKTSAAWQKMDAERAAWAARLPDSVDAIFPWVLSQEPITVQQLLTFLIASTVTGVYGVERSKQSTDPLAVALGLDMSKWWSATGPSYFNHVSKSRILEVVKEAADANAASPLAALKKDAVVTGAEQTVAGTGWLPTVLRVGMPEKVNPSGDTDELPVANGEEQAEPDGATQRAQKPALAG
ncbi:ParB/Srx family N-terminal domain-containing protein [Hydrogenophaga sp.]|uniref:ParB/RepB/Spo0J family partition protein n=1 Tax=Hydrogenophaga sp. TaxID=1904254 RepID=UPI00273467B0|nr:ParB/Srx family N-terminal domain-containing protein [Hydrogenophaga sp.]MDP3323238.1 ParB/Srx family N-terminal domain-containing protein [Hydrogenophaga sp.]MDP3888272.1 ParB/Srx family N-terminal domain-containing protein [Hydrogenophaga sp.]